ncbi:MAG: hypothetical protein JO114_04715 [Planctomycetaceae bacterium]|nr:hypothetical protein [Planctomycetaceae bacterium]
MSRSRPFASLPSTRGFGALIVAFAVVGSALLTPPLAPAQGFGGQSAVAQEIKIKSPVASQVFQRKVNDRAVDKMKQIHAAENWIAIRARSARWFGQGASRRSA